MAERPPSIGHSISPQPSAMKRLLLLATTTGYQTRAFGDAAERLGVELVFATDRCGMLDDPWRDAAIPIRFHEEDASVDAILDAARARPIDGVLAVGDRPTVIAARVTHALGLPWHPAEAAAVARHKQLTRERLRDAGLPVPWFLPFTLSSQPSALLSQPSALSPQPLSYPCIVKPVSLSGSRGVMRADDPATFAACVERLRALLASPDIRAERNEAHDSALVEGFIPGREYAVEGLMHHGALHTLAIFDKPDPLDGPFFEETIYVTPPSVSSEVQDAIVRGVSRAAEAIGLRHGPVHAECRVSPSTGSGHAAVFVLEVAARPIGGLCARALQFEKRGRASLEELLLRHALGESPDGWVREAAASGVMMIPIPRRGILRGVDGLDAARSVPRITDLRVTAKMDQRLVPLPEGASYLGFIFARAEGAGDVERALRAAHAQLRFTIDSEFPMLAAAQVDYNLQHG
ncbi:MAG: ATP-grasp domain-containing protein [Acidobacteria bacterium]|nr:ATP-grasp domain-containing protein [Acidobacteriota bacterium]